jgi:hypothetical protein
MASTQPLQLGHRPTLRPTGRRHRSISLPRHPHLGQAFDLGLVLGMAGRDAEQLRGVRPRLKQPRDELVSYALITSAAFDTGLKSLP